MKIFNQRTFFELMKFFCYSRIFFDFCEHFKIHEHFVNMWTFFFFRIRNISWFTEHLFSKSRTFFWICKQLFQNHEHFMILEHFFKIHFFEFFWSPELFEWRKKQKAKKKSKKKTNLKKHDTAPLRPHVSNWTWSNERWAEPNATHTGQQRSPSRTVTDRPVPESWNGSAVSKRWLSASGTHSKKTGGKNLLAAKHDGGEEQAATLTPKRPVSNDGRVAAS